MKAIRPIAALGTAVFLAWSIPGAQAQDNPAAAPKAPAKAAPDSEKGKAAPPRAPQPGAAKAAAPKAAAQPQAPVTAVDGEWMVGDGSARMRIGSCGADTTVCGFTAWTREPPGLDHRNPDPGKRGQSIIGTQILIDMKQAKPDRWEGTIYNPKDGKIYQASLTRKGADELRVEGCLLGFLCGGDTWTRAVPEENASAPAPRGASAKGSPASGTPGAAAARPTQKARAPQAEEALRETVDPE